MPSSSSPIHSSVVSRSIYVLTTLLVFFYILFDVLDPDGSSFPRPLTPVKRTVIAAVVGFGAQLNHLSERFELDGHMSLRFTDRSAEYSRPPWRAG
jgi:hypothetical protein